MKRYLRILALPLVFFLYPALLHAQGAKRYQSLLWEITGNGLKRPSYLFGTMHVSSKLAFHVSDSFYNAIARTDMVAIELDPELMQSESLVIKEQTAAYESFYKRRKNNYLNEKTYTRTGLENNIMYALRLEPRLNNMLLYRTTRGDMNNFEENTYLDLYIYQTGKRLGKQFTGIEDFWESERLAIEAAADARMNRKKKEQYTRSAYGIGQYIQDAYRRGDLDALDSLEKLNMDDDMSLEKFLYKRNENMARAMDSIMKTQSLFTGVGSAHLPGGRGVIALLRKKGYRLRPVMMNDRDVTKKAAADTIRVPVHLSRQYAADSFYTVMAPGKLYPLDKAGNMEVFNHADMANGSYYMVSRIKTNLAFQGYNSNRVLKITDSLLYESVPGKILSKEAITVDGYHGLSLTSRTRRGDIQRYSIIATAAELLIFKISGTENYALGTEGDKFLHSIHLRSLQYVHTPYTPPGGGFEVQFPTRPLYRHYDRVEDGYPQEEYEAVNAETGDSYTLIKRSVQQRYLSADSFNVRLVLESFFKDAIKEKKLKQVQYLNYYGRVAADAFAQNKDGSYTRARVVVSGPEYYLMVLRSKTEQAPAEAFFNSFRFTPYTYGTANVYRDNLMKFTVRTPVRPQVGKQLNALFDYSRKAIETIKSEESKYDDDPHTEYASFIHPQTGETIKVAAKAYPKYSYKKDSVNFYTNIIEDSREDSDLMVTNRQSLLLTDKTPAISYTLKDTGTSAVIRKLIFSKGLTCYEVSMIKDSLQPESSFEKDFFKTITPFAAKSGASVFTNKATLLYAGYHAADSNTRKQAQDAIPDVYFGKKGYPVLLKLLAEIKPSQKNYFELKRKLITELGYLKDSTIEDVATDKLGLIYKQVGDTAMFQNAVLNALIHIHSRNATLLFKKLVLQDPPITSGNDGGSDYTALFNFFEEDSLNAPLLFPEVLQLTTIEDFRRQIISLLSVMRQQKRIQPAQYQSYMQPLEFNARIEMKRQKNRDEKAMVNEGGDNSSDNVTPYKGDGYSYTDTFPGILYDYAVILAPFYDTSLAVKEFFNEVMATRDNALKLKTAILLTQMGQPVAGDVWKTVAKKGEYRIYLYNSLKKAGLEKYYPKEYASQQEMAASMIYQNQTGNAKDLKYVGKQLAQVKNREGYVYVFKYKYASTDQWVYALTGLQPANPAQYNTNNTIMVVKMIDEGSQPESVAEMVRKAVIAATPAGKYFFANSSGNEYYTETVD